MFGQALQMSDLSMLFSSVFVFHMKVFWFFPSFPQKNLKKSPPEGKKIGNDIHCNFGNLKLYQKGTVKVNVFEGMWWS